MLAFDVMPGEGVYSRAIRAEKVVSPKIKYSGLFAEIALFFHNLEAVLHD